MRRRDLIWLFVLIWLIGYSWQQLKPPTLEAEESPVDEQLIDSLSSWHGPIEAAQAVGRASVETNLSKSLNGSNPAPGRVLGLTSDGEAPVENLSADQDDSRPFSPPTSLLPVEEYVGAPFHYSLESMLQELGVTLHPEDVASVFPDPSLGLGATIRIYRATPVTIVDWGKSKKLRTWQSDVQSLLDEQGIELGDNDRVEPTAKAALSVKNGSATVTITRVAITEVKTKEKIEFKKREREDAELPRGQIKVTPGQPGERTKTFRVTRENGVEVKRELIKNEVTKEPSDEIRIIGTKVLIGRSYTGRASWYKYNSTKVATDHFKRGTNLRITNLDNGKVIFVRNDGCICADTGYVVDLHPDHFTALGGVIRDGVMKRIKVDEILN